MVEKYKTCGERWVKSRVQTEGIRNMVEKLDCGKMWGTKIKNTRLLQVDNMVIEYFVCIPVLACNHGKN